MKITKFRFRVVEMVLAPIGIILIDGGLHYIEGRPILNEYLWGACIATLAIRGIDALRAFTNQWPEN